MPHPGAPFGDLASLATTLPAVARVSDADCPACPRWMAPAGGNCSFALAPLRTHDAGYTRRMMARVEGMPLAALEHGVPWTWET